LAQSNDFYDYKKQLSLHEIQKCNWIPALLPQSDPPLLPSAPHRTADLLQMNQIVDGILTVGYSQTKTSENVALTASSSLFTCGKCSDIKKNKNNNQTKKHYTIHEQIKVFTCKQSSTKP
jgi:hypothetical protein